MVSRDVGGNRTEARAGGKFEDAVAALVKQFGSKKRSTFVRWSHMAQTLPPALRQMLDSHPELPQGLAARLAF